MSYTAQADKLDHEYEVLWMMLEREDESVEHAVLLVQQCKRVQRASNLLLRTLAERRDTLQR